jgi:hypothetical protein
MTIAASRLAVKAGSCAVCTVMCELESGITVHRHGIACAAACLNCEPLHVTVSELVMVKEPVGSGQWGARVLVLNLV